MPGREEGRRRSLRAALIGSALVSLTVFASFALVDGCSGGDDRGDGDPPPQRACTLIACGPGVRVELERLPPDTRFARLCIDGACGARRAAGGGRLPLTGTLPRSARRAGAQVQVSVVLLDVRGRRIGQRVGRTAVSRSRPNGPDCPPVCFRARLRLDRDAAV